MAIASVHSDGIRLQAERVVRKYKELRAATGSSFEPNPEFPVGLFAELVTQIRQLERWLPPVEGEPKDLHAQTIAEVREENADADERENAVRVAIRESIGMTRDEQDATYERIAAAMLG